MKKGAFTWHLRMRWLDVTIVTPLLLCDVDKVVGGDDYSHRFCRCPSFSFNSRSTYRAFDSPVWSHRCSGPVEQLGMHLQFYNFLGKRQQREAKASIRDRFSLVIVQSVRASNRVSYKLQSVF